MSVALISLSPRTIISVFNEIPDSFKLESGDVVAGADIGWSNKEFSLVTVQSFELPEGQFLVGAPTYDLDKDGNVIESYSTQPIPPLLEPSARDLAQVALDATDTTALRCFKAGVAFPVEWQTYVKALRDIVRSGKGDLPVRPSYPAGT